MKRGLGHVEAIIAFVIFTGFLVFTFIFFSPLRTGRTLESSLDYAWREVELATEAPIEIYSVVLAANTPPTVGIKIPGVSFNASVENSSGSVIPSYTDSTYTVHFRKPSNNFALIKYASEFTKGAVITGTQTNNYTISSSETSAVRFENKFLALNASYNLNYNTLKTQFNLPNRVSFGFDVKFEDGTVVHASREIPEEAEVLSELDRVEIARTNGKIEYADLTVFVW